MWLILVGFDCKSQVISAILSTKPSRSTENTYAIMLPFPDIKGTCSTNTVEAYHRMVRKFTLTKAIFPTDDFIRKVVFLTVEEISKKWTMPARDWARAYSQIMICFADRFAA